MGYLKEECVLPDVVLRTRPGFELTEEYLLVKRFKDNVKLANYVANRYTKSVSHYAALSAEDIIQDAYLGLWEACLDFDESFGTAFSTYAVPKIRGRILRELRDFEIIKTPRYFRDMRATLREMGIEYPFSDEDIQRLLDTHKFSLKQIMSYAEVPVCSLDQPLDDSANSSSVGELIGFPEKEYDSLSDDGWYEVIELVSSFISSKYRDMIEEWLISVYEECPLNQTELGTKYGCSQAQVSRVENSAVRVFQENREEIRKLLGL